MKIARIIFLFVYLSTDCKSQNASKIPVLLKQLFFSKSDSAKVEAYRDLCFNYSHANADSGIYYGKKGLEIAQKINFIKGIGDCYNSIGWCQIRKGDYVEAKKNLLLAKSYFEKTGNKCYIAVVYNNLGSLFYNQNLYADALENYIKSVKLTDGCADVGFKASGIYSIGTIYNAQKEYRQAINYFNQAEKINILNADSNKAAECYNGIGNAFLGMQNYDSAIFYLQKAINLYSLYDNINGVAYAQESIGSIFLEKKNFSKALENFEAAKKNFEALGSLSDVCYELTMISGAYRKMGDLNTAIQYQKKALAIADSNQFLSTKQKAMESLSELYALQNEYKNAYNYFKESIFLKDSVDSKNQQTKLDELKTKFETEKKDKQIELLNKNKIIDLAESAKQKQLKNIFIAGAIMLLLLAMILYNRYQIKRKSALELEEKNKIIQKEKERAEKSEKFKQQFLANMSHEIRTPMNSILGMTELLEDTALEENQKKYFDAIKHSSQNLLVIINDILDLTKLEVGKMTLESISFNLIELIENIELLFQYKLNEKKLELIIDVHTKVPQFIFSDPTRLQQILVNLIGNAIKFTEKGKICLMITKENENLHFFIKDTGIGIPSEKIKQIFDSFTQSNTGDSRKYGGTGLGLTISKNLIELFGGNIFVKSELNKGSEFSFFIPLCIDKKTPHLGREEKEKDYFSSEINQSIHVILVEDNEYNRMLVIDGLKRKIENIRITIAKNGKQAIHLLSSMETLDPSEKMIVLMDIQMPEMDGFETTKKIRSEFEAPIKNLPIIAITASVIKSDLEKCIDAGMNDYISKPFKIVELVSKVLKHTQSNQLVSKNQANIEEKENSHHENRITDLSYLHNFTEGDAVEIKKYIAIFNNRIPVGLAEAEAALKQKDYGSVLSILHSLKPLMVSVGLSESEKIISSLENSGSKINEDERMTQFFLIKKECFKALEELQQVI